MGGRGPETDDESDQKIQLNLLWFGDPVPALLTRMETCSISTGFAGIEMICAMEGFRLG
jgi:hypothetical protein